VVDERSISGNKSRAELEKEEASEGSYDDGRVDEGAGPGPMEGGM
jgi:hypothetical protein